MSKCSCSYSCQGKTTWRILTSKNRHKGWNENISAKSEGGLWGKREACEEKTILWAVSFAKLDENLSAGAWRVQSASQLSCQAIIQCPSQSLAFANMPIWISPASVPFLFFSPFIKRRLFKCWFIHNYLKNGFHESILSLPWYNVVLPWITNRFIIEIFILSL